MLKYNKGIAQSVEAKKKKKTKYGVYVNNVATN